MPEAFTSSIITVFIKFMTVFITLSAAFLVSYSYNRISIILFFSLQSLSCILIMFVNDKLHRKILDETTP